MAARKRQHRAAATVTGPRFRFIDIEAGMMANGVPFACGAVPMMWAPRSANSGTRATRRDHVEHPAALVNSSGLWVSSRTRGGTGGMLRLQAADVRSAR
jgi:hypothetical protein